jgi:hypothetical protein
MEKILLNFIDSTGADANQFIFNFKRDLNRYSKGEN